MNRRTLRILAVASFAALASLAVWTWNETWKADNPRNSREFGKFSVEFFDTFDTLVSFTAF
ncbi:MAG: hypothetical protein LBJ22_04010, partial [Synergistaceae bacterium]|nr:hypothetical protein [Synergistaceae bacterium]